MSHLDVFGVGREDDTGKRRRKKAGKRSLPSERHRTTDKQRLPTTRARGEMGWHKEWCGTAVVAIIDNVVVWVHCCIIGIVANP